MEGSLETVLVCSQGISILFYSILFYSILFLLCGLVSCVVLTEEISFTASLKKELSHPSIPPTEADNEKKNSSVL
jgi:hypothetical protein